MTYYSYFKNVFTLRLRANGVFKTPSQDVITGYFNEVENNIDNHEQCGKLAIQYANNYIEELNLCVN